jgi:hypothetical protein
MRDESKKRIGRRFFVYKRERERLKLFIKENVPEGKSECVA